MTDTTPKVRMFMQGQGPLVQALYESLQKNGVDVTDDQFDTIFIDLCVGLKERSKHGMAGLSHGLGHKLPIFTWRPGWFEYVVDVKDARWKFAVILPENGHAPTQVRTITRTEIKSGAACYTELSFADIDISRGSAATSPWRVAYWLEDQFESESLTQTGVKLLLDHRAG